MQPDNYAGAELSAETVAAVLAELVRCERLTGDMDMDRADNVAHSGGYALVAFQIARRCLERGVSRESLLDVCVKHVELEAAPLDLDDAVMLGKVRGIYQAIRGGAFRRLDIWEGASSTNDVERVQKAIRESGDESNEWWVMAWVELAQAALYLCSNAEEKHKTSSTLSAVLWVAEGLGHHANPRSRVEAFVNDLRQLLNEGSASHAA